MDESHGQLGSIRGKTNENSRGKENEEKGDKQGHEKTPHVSQYIRL